MTKLDFEAKRPVLRCNQIGLPVLLNWTSYGIQISQQAIGHSFLPTTEWNPWLEGLDLVGWASANRGSKNASWWWNYSHKTTGKKICLATVKNCRAKMGWTFHGTRYCQMITKLNGCSFRWRRNIRWCYLDWWNISSVVMSFQKKNDKPKFKPHPKYPLKVHVWAGISKHGATRVTVFEGIMDAPFYVRILHQYLVPFINSRVSFHTPPNARQWSQARFKTC